MPVPAGVKIDAVFASKLLDVCILLQILRRNVLNIVIDGEHRLRWIGDCRRADLFELGNYCAGVVVRHDMPRGTLTDWLRERRARGRFRFDSPRHVMTHDNTGAVIPKFKQIGATTIADPAQPVFANRSRYSKRYAEESGEVCKHREVCSRTRHRFLPGRHRHFAPG